jgi:RNA polymerase sigma-70 factor (ECF subfamily)
LVKRNTQRIFAICYGIIGNIEDAEDMVQETFMKGLKKIKGLRSETRFSCWLAQMARNLCIDLIRRKKRQKSPIIDGSAAVEQGCILNDPYLDLQEALQQLPEKHRLPLVLYYFDERSTKNIAEVLDVSQALVHTRLSRARKELRRLLSEKEEAK